MAWYGFVELRGLNGKVARKTWKLQATGDDGTAFTQALAGLVEIKESLDAISAASINDYGVSYLVEAYVVGAGDLTEQALINVWAEDIENTTDVLAISQVYVPAPVIGVFVAATGPNMDIVDVNDAALAAYIDDLSSYAYISDHEVIDVGTATAGIENGRRVTRKSR